MNKVIGTSLLLLVACMTGLSQIYTPVKWSSTIEHIEGEDYLLIHTAEIDEGWSVYSQNLESDDGPVATEVGYDDQSHFELIGASEEEGNKKEGFDEIFEMNVIKYVEELVLKQRIRLKDKGPISGYVYYMSCDATKCLPPTDHTFELTPMAAPAPGSGGSNDGDQKSQNGGGAQDPGTPNPFGDVDTHAEVEAPAEVEMPLPEQSGILEPVAWTASIDQSARIITIEGTIETGWHIYSQSNGPDDGPIPTEVLINGEAVTAIEQGKKVEQGFDDIFEVDITKIKEGVRLEVPLPAGEDVIQGEVVYMACDKSKCIMPDPYAFAVDLKHLTLLDESTGSVDEATAGDLALFTLDQEKIQDPIGSCDDVAVTEVKEQGFWSIFGLGFIGGLLALLTPCVFPMIPLTVSFFTKSSGNRTKGLRNATLYGGFILLIYLLLSAPFHLMDSINPDILNDISTNVVLNLAFFAIFLFFAFSFFGFYEITMPSKWSNKASQAEGIGGFIGIFFMALTLALVSFSCTGPILGTLLAGALTSDGGATQLTAGMGGFGLALALPFTLFAAFPGLMGSIPKSGGWLNTVKVVLGFLELGLAFKFLSNADLVKRWGLLKIEPFLIIEIIIFLGLALYLFGKIKFPHDSPIKKLSPARIGLGIVSAAFAFYLASGFRVNEDTNTFTSLTLLSGLAPPVGYSWIYPNKCPNNLDCFKDLESGLAHARKVNKPVMIDFTGHACVNCRRMEEHVWPERQVIKHLQDDYVLISLYVDEKIELPEDEQMVVTRGDGSSRKLRTVGNKWSHFQTEYFQTNAQPYYVLISPEGELLNAPVGYVPDADEYAAFLSCGLSNFEDRKAGLLGMAK
ncbi:MAG: thioredoxin family protein [Saprospiraceae bacterium]|nr:thioredoxin family protein [Saprospiraceae bacterium]